MSKGYFVTFEGIDGCGKSTQATLLADALEQRGLTVSRTREPGGTPISEKIREILIDPRNKAMVDECELLLYIAARAQHVREKIVPLVESGAIVICDRFQDATFAYQGYGRGISIDFLKKINAYATGIEPDCTFVFDLPVDRAFGRMTAMNKSHDRIESAGRDFFEKIRVGYLTLAQQYPDRIVVLDGILPKEQLAEMVVHHIDSLIQSAKSL